MTETWNGVIGYESHYEVSSLGRVRRILESAGARKLVLKPEVDKLGYARVRLWKYGVSQKFQIHRLVMSAFVGPSILTVNHRNGNPRDNSLENLAYLSLAENLKDSWTRPSRDGLNQGSKHGMHKIEESDVVSIRKRRENGESQKSIAAHFGISVPSVSMIVNRKTWTHVL